MGGKSGGGIVGYKYYMGIHMGVCRGPVDEIPEIKVGDRTAWPIGVGDTTPTESLTASMPSNTMFELIEHTDFFGVPHTQMGYVRFTVSGGFSSQFATNKLMTITGTSREVEITVYDEFGTPFTYSTTVNVDGSYQIMNNLSGGVVTIAVSNFDQWNIAAPGGHVLAYHYPTINFSTTSGSLDAGDTASGYPADVSKRIYINAPNLFGGNKGEGGIDGPCDVMMGEATQPVNTDLQAMLGASRLSAFRGMLTLFFDGLVTSLNPYPKEWKFRIRRTLKGWADDNVFYSSKCRINIPYGSSGSAIQAMNPAHILYECVTNPDWGRGMSSALIDEDAFTAAADTLYDEGFGLCLKWTRQDNIDVFIQTVIDHIGAAMFVSRLTGLLTLRLIRADYDPDALPTFDMTTGAISVLEDQSTSTQPLVNEITVQYVDPRSGDEAEIRVQNIASMQAYGSIVSETVQYPGIPSAALAGRVAQRDLRIKGLPLRRMRISFDRRAYSIEPGGVFKYVDPRRNIGAIILRVGRVDDGLEGGSEVEVTCVEDVFGLGSASYVGVPEVIAPPAGGVQPAAYERVFEASYYDLRLLLPVADIIDNVGYVVASASRATGLHQDFSVHTSEVPADIEERGGSAFVAGALLAADVAYSDLLMTVEGVKDGDLITIGMTAMVGNEIMRVDSFNSATNEVWISRGCVDTLPAAHIAGAVVLFYDRIGAVDSTPYAEGDTVYGKVVTRSNSGELNPALATLYEVDLIGRVGRPYPPGNVRVNDIQYGLPMLLQPPILVVEWAHRNKVTQAENLVTFLDDSLTPAAGLTYTLGVYRSSDDSLLREVTGITGDTWTYEAAMWTADGGVEEIYLKLISVEDGEESWQPVIMPVTIDAAGWGNNWGESWGSLF